MNIEHRLNRPAVGENGSSAGPASGNRLLRKALAIAAGLAMPLASQAIDFGPFTLTGFAKAEVTHLDSYCPDCQRDPLAPKQFPWADELVQGKAYGSGTTHVTLFQPYLAVKFALPRGFKVSGLLSQRLQIGRAHV